MTENNEISQKIKKPRVKTAPLAKYYNDNLQNKKNSFYHQKFSDHSQYKYSASNTAMYA